MLKESSISTPLGEMLVIADQRALYLLEFVDWLGLEREVSRLRRSVPVPMTSGKTPPMQHIETELKAYFSGQLREFKTPLFLRGSSFQKTVWKELQTIPFGETRSYADVAAAIGNPGATRAVGTANGANSFAIIIPCHRVISKNGDIGGYGGGIDKKKWLLSHERK